MTLAQTELLKLVPAPVVGAAVPPTLDVVERLVFERVDGKSTVTEISDAIGIEPDLAHQVLRKLVERGIVEVGGSPAPSASGTSSDRLQALGTTTDPMAEDIDLSADVRRSILEAEQRMGASFYALLGVELSADRKIVREAYFALSKLFHPDAYYGKRLGSFRRRLDTLFGRLTLAYEVLTNKDKREQYDGFLGSQVQLDEARRRMEDSRRDAEGVKQKMREQVQRARDAARRARFDERARRQHLARKLAAAAGRKLGAPAPVGPKRSAKEAADAVKRLLGDSGFSDRLDKAKDHAANAEIAMRAGDFVSAANDFRMALALEARNPTYRARYEEAAVRAREQLAEGYFKQGRFEESMGDAVAAVQHYCLAAEQSASNADYAYQAARLLLYLKKDLHRAREMALRAIKNRPGDARSHELLGLIYMDAGLGQSARREMETALGLDPGNDGIKEHLRVARKMA